MLYIPTTALYRANGQAHPTNAYTSYKPYIQIGIASRGGHTGSPTTRRTNVGDNCMILYREYMELHIFTSNSHA